MNDKAPVQKGYQQLTPLDTAKPVKPPAGASFAIIRCTGADVRWRDDGQAPTASTGYPLAVGEELHYDSQTGILNLQFIQQSASAEVSVLFYGA